ncbi:MAG: hypothetical protein CME06_18385 [Gemmatimonadetes bacterium]|nr:hypothetical protein [Gemmatimonadota bacterium]
MLSSEAGGQQGDPVAPLAFSLALNEILPELAAAAADGPGSLDLLFSYLDDGWIAGDEMTCTVFGGIEEEDQGWMELHKIRHWIRAEEQTFNPPAPFRPLLAFTSGDPGPGMPAGWDDRSTEETIECDIADDECGPHERFKKIARAVDVIVPNHFPLQNCGSNAEEHVNTLTRIAIDAIRACDLDPNICHGGGCGGFTVAPHPVNGCDWNGTEYCWQPTAVWPAVQIYPNKVNTSPPSPGQVNSMVASSIAAGATGVVLYRSTGSYGELPNEDDYDTVRLDCPQTPPPLCPQGPIELPLGLTTFCPIWNLLSETARCWLDNSDGGCLGRRSAQEFYDGLNELNQGWDFVIKGYATMHPGPDAVWEVVIDNKTEVDEHDVVDTFIESNEDGFPNNETLLSIGNNYEMPWPDGPVVTRTLLRFDDLSDLEGIGYHRVDLQLTLVGQTAWRRLTDPDYGVVVVSADDEDPDRTDFAPMRLIVSPVPDEVGGVGVPWTEGIEWGSVKAGLEAAYDGEDDKYFERYMPESYTFLRDAIAAHEVLRTSGSGSFMDMNTQLLRIDVTGIVDQWLADPSGNHGLYLTGYRRIDPQNGETFVGDPIALALYDSDCIGPNSRCIGRGFTLATVPNLIAYVESGKPHSDPITVVEESNDQLVTIDLVTGRDAQGYAVVLLVTGDSNACSQIRLYTNRIDGYADIEILELDGTLRATLPAPAVRQAPERQANGYLQICPNDSPGEELDLDWGEIVIDSPSVIGTNDAVLVRFKRP